MKNRITRRDCLRIMGMSGLGIGTGSVIGKQLLPQDIGESGFQSSVITTNKVQENRSNAVLIDGKVRSATILSPCCSIGEKTLALSPLLQVLPGFFRNPYLNQDLTNVNRLMTPEQAVPPDVWEDLPRLEKLKRLNLSKPKSYAFVHYFIYAPHDLMPQYTVHSKHGNVETGYYMVDFRRIYRVECEKVVNAKQAPLEIKLLQLSIQTRNELREKIASYFNRVPEEDKV